jgi:hypothetical protein
VSSTLCSPVYGADDVTCLICKRSDGEECLFKKFGGRTEPPKPKEDTDA